MRDHSRVLLVMMFILLGPLVAFALPQLAVLEALLAAGMDPTVGPLITSKIEEEFVKSGKYTVLDRANIDRVLREKEFQLSSGLVANEQIRQAGEYLGADFVVIANVSRIGQTYVISAKMIDVVSGEIAAQTSHEQAGRIDVLLDIARVVGSRLAGTELAVAKAEEPKKEEPKKAEVPPPQPKAPRAPRVAEPLELKRFVAGVKAGGNLAGINTDTWFDWYYLDYWDDSWNEGGHYVDDEWAYSRFGLTAGAYLGLNLNRYLGLQVELLYSTKGYQYDFEDYFDDGFIVWYLGWVTNRFTFSYLEIPLLLKARLPGRISPYLVAGASIAVLIDAKVENIYEDSISQDLFDTTWDNPADLIDYWGEELFTVDAGLVAGLGVDYLRGSMLFNLDVRYTLGLLAVSEWYGFTNGALSVTVGAGYQF